VTDEMTELYDADIPRVDAVDKAANGTRWFLMKTEESNGLLSHDQVAELIKETAEEDGMADNTDPVVKDDLNAGGDPLASSGNPGALDPGSAPWEQVDADTAAKWLAILARAKHALLTLSEREEVESATPDSDGDEMDNAWDLQDAASAIDYAIGIVAAYGASEQAEVDLEDDVAKARLAAIGDVAKAILDDPADLTALEVSSVTKTANPDAATALLAALRDLPEAPAVEKAEEPVEEPTVEKAEDTEEAPVVEKAETSERVASVEEAVAKFGRFSPEARQARVLSKQAPEPVADVVKDDAAAADGEDTPELEAVFDANGNLKGVVDPSAIQPVQGATADAPEDKTPDEPAPAAPAPAPAAAAPAAPAVPAAKAAEHDEETKPEERVVTTKAEIEALFAERIAAVEASLRKEVESLRAPARPAAARYGVFPAADLRRVDDVEKKSEEASQEKVLALKEVIRKSGDPQAIEAANDALTSLVSAELAKQRAALPTPPRPTPGVPRQ
jgi:hypothetical protein